MKTTQKVAAVIYISLLVITFGFILVNSLRWVLGSELFSSRNDIITDSSEWRLLVDGSVYRPLNLTYKELVAMPKSSEYAELYCYSAFVTNGNWTGVRLGLILEKTGLYRSSEFYAKGIIEFYAEDGYTITLPVATAIREDVIIAYEKDGVLLPEMTRLVVPHENGDVWISMISHIKLLINQ